MHILFLADNFPPEVNAPSTRVYERALHWIKWGYKVTVITSAPNFPRGKVFDGYKNKWYQREEMNGIEVIRVKTFMTSNSGFLLRTLDFLSYIPTAFFAALVQRKVDVVVSTSPQFFVAVTGWLVSIFKRKPFIFELGDLWPASIKAVGMMDDSLIIKFLEKVELFLYRRAKAVVALTQSFKSNLISRGIDENKISVVINGVELSKYHRMKKHKELLSELSLQNKFVVGYIGTHGLAHQLENVVNAAKIFQDNTNIHVIFVGSGAAREGLIKKKNELGLTNITFVAEQPKEVIANYWSLCDLVLVHLKNDPVFAEVIPSKIFEAMGMGLPILIAAPKGEASQIVVESGAGEWVEAGQPAKLAQAISHLYSNPDVLHKLTDASEAAAPNYSREQQATKMIKVIEKVVADYKCRKAHQRFRK